MAENDVKEPAVQALIAAINDGDRRALLDISSGHGQSPRRDAALDQVAARGKEMAQQLADCAESARFLELMSLDQAGRQNRRVIIDRAGKVRLIHRSYRPGDENEYLDSIRSLIRE